MKQSNEQPTESIQGSKNTWVIVIAVFVTALIVGGGVYVWQRSNLKSTEQNLEQQISVLQNRISQLQQVQPVQPVQPVQDQPNTEQSQNVENSNQVTTPVAKPVSNDQKPNWQVHSNARFDYKCPNDWSLNENLNHNGQVELSACSKMYSSSKISFDDGVIVSFGFVPQTVADNYEWSGQKWSDTLIDEVKNESNAQQYSNNNFVGWISMKNSKHTLKIIARYQVDGGYYELSADATGDTKTDQEFKKNIDDIVSTFSIK